MKTQGEIQSLLSAYGRGERPDLRLADVALWLGALERPALPVDRYIRHIDDLAHKVGGYARIDVGPVPVALMAEALFQVLARHHGYGGSESGIYDEDCFDLTRVLDQRSGASETLAILYAEIARRLAWSVEIIRIPGRLLLRFESVGERIIIDPLGDDDGLSPADIRALAKAFGGNETELTPGSLNPLDDKTVLLRLLSGRKKVLLRGRKLEDASAILKSALLLAPDDPALWRECGLLFARLDRVSAAIEALEHYLELDDGDNGRYHTTVLLQELRNRLT